MNPLRTLCLMACLVAATMATPNAKWSGNRRTNSNSLSGKQDPSNWVSQSEIEQLPNLNEVTLKRLGEMTVDEGASVLDKLYHLSQFNGIFEPSYVPEPSEIKGFIVGQQGEKVPFNLNTLVQTARRQPNFGSQEVTIFIQGLPESWPQVAKANRKLVQAYIQRYNLQPYNNDDDDTNEERQVQRRQNPKNNDNDNDNDYNGNNGDLVVINLGETIEDFEQYATLDVERVGRIVGNRLVQLTNEVNVPQEIIHLIGQGAGAHVAGVAGRQFARQTGHILSRITGLDPSRLYSRTAYTLNGLARGDATFVDVIHTSAYGMGTPVRGGDVDFYPNGPNTGVPGADNVIEASVRATRYFAESVRPGNERNFPAVAASSYQEYKQNNGYGRRIYMGIDTARNAKGDYILQVNPKSPFGRSTPAQTQNGYHAVHEAWKNTQQRYN